MLDSGHDTQEDSEEVKSQDEEGLKKARGAEESDQPEQGCDKEEACAKEAPGACKEPKRDIGEVRA